MYVIGISAFAHESSCALLKDGEIRVMIEEERLNRKKHTFAFPEQAIRECLAVEGISIEDIDHFTFFWDPMREIRENLGHFLRWFPKSLRLLTPGSGSKEVRPLTRIYSKMTVGKTIADRFNMTRTPTINFVEHHLCHAASAFLVSPFTDSAILTIDGRGERASTMLAFGNGNGIRKLETVNVPHSLGHLYAAVTDHLGFQPFFDEWKVMGLSAYGTDRLEKLFRNVVNLLPAGNFRLNLDFFEFHTQGRRAWTSPHFTDTFGPKRHFDGTYTQHHYDLAYALQKTVEDAGTHIAKRLYDLTHSDNLCLTGGVALNVLMNRAIIEQTAFKNIFIQPIANDAGTSLGSALYHYHVNLNGSRKFIFDNVYWGPEYSNREIEMVLKEVGVRYKKVDNIAQQTAQHIADSRIVGWFQGRMESGPRALGNRSITVNPTDQNMKDILNARVKKREFFRPFAPSILEEKVSEFFEMPKNLLSPYMVLVGNVKEEKRKLIPAVTHADNTARVHTVSRETNPRYWQLINEFYKLTGVPVLLNTSFNENEPIVCTPRHAIDCFLRTDFDVLAIGDFIIEK